MLQLKKAVTIFRVSRVILGFALFGAISCAGTAPDDNSIADSHVFFGDPIEQFQRLKAIRERQERIELEHVAQTRAETLEVWLDLQLDEQEAQRLEATREQIREANRDRSLKTHFDEWMWINR